LDATFTLPLSRVENNKWRTDSKLTLDSSAFDDLYTPTLNPVVLY